jgi:hypothetical protein
MAHVLACLRQVAPAGNAADMAVINRQQLGTPKHPAPMDPTFFVDGEYNSWTMVEYM